MAANRYTVILEPAEEGGYAVKCLELPVTTQGETRKEALANIKEAIELYLETKTDLYNQQPKGERVEMLVETPKTPPTTNITPSGKPS